MQAHTLTALDHWGEQPAADRSAQQQLPNISPHHPQHTAALPPPPPVPLTRQRPLPPPLPGVQPHTVPPRAAQVEAAQRARVPGVQPRSIRGEGAAGGGGGLIRVIVAAVGGAQGACQGVPQVERVVLR